MKVVITGATGLVGSQLVRELRDRGDTAVAISRDAERARARLGIEAIAGDIETPGPWCDALAHADAVVHLAGEPVAGKRWDARQKQRIRDSRIESARVIVEAIGKLETAARPKALISASGIDYYPYAIDGLGDDEDVTEADPSSESFLGRVCRDWENEVAAAATHGVRTVSLRTGLVLGGEAIDKLAGPFKWFVGGRIGSGEQWVSWISLVDAAAVYADAIHDPRYAGPINLVTDSVRQRDFAKALGAALHRPSWLPVPKFAVKAAAGEFADAVLKGRRVVPAKLRALGYRFRQPELDGALSAAVSTT